MLSLQDPTTKKGCDVSRWQGGINYGVFNLDFVFYKATGGDMVLYTDSKFHTNAAGFNTAEGPYHYAGPGSPIQEANYFADVILDSAWGDMDQSRQLPPVLDWEPTWNPRPQAALNWVVAFLRTLEDRVQRKPLLYTGAYVPLQRDPILLEWDLWLAAYTPAPINCPPWPYASVWQYGSTGSVAGVQGGCDTNIALPAWFDRELNVHPNNPPQPGIPPVLIGDDDMPPKPFSLRDDRNFYIDAGAAQPITSQEHLHFLANTNVIESVEVFEVTDPALVAIIAEQYGIGPV